MTAAELDAAVLQHMTHGAMAGADPLVDSFFDQLDACAAEGAQPALPYAAGTVTEPDHPGWWLLAIALLATLVGGCFYPWGA